MANKDSIRVMQQREREFDRVSILIKKGGKHLLHAQAKREDVTVAEMMRRAILARAGLKRLPDASELEQLADVETRDEARKALLALQESDSKAQVPNNLLYRDPRYVAIPISRKQKAEYLTALDELRKMVCDIQETGSAPVHVKVSQKSLAAVERLLANIEIPRGEGEMY